MKKAEENGQFPFWTFAVENESPKTRINMFGFACSIEPGTHSQSMSSEPFSPMMPHQHLNTRTAYSMRQTLKSIKSNWIKESKNLWFSLMNSSSSSFWSREMFVSIYFYKNKLEFNENQVLFSLNSQEKSNGFHSGPEMVRTLWIVTTGLFTSFFVLFCSKPDKAETFLARSLFKDTNLPRQQNWSKTRAGSRISSEFSDNCSLECSCCCCCSYQHAE